MDVVTSTLPGSTTPNGENPTIIEGTMHRRWIDRNVRLLQVSHAWGFFWAVGTCCSWHYREPFKLWSTSRG